MGYFQVRYNSRVVNYDHRGFIGLATDHSKKTIYFGVRQRKEGSNLATLIG